MSQTVSYRVSMPEPHSHLFEVQARFPPSEGPWVLSLPVWTPGSYLVREYARHLQDFSASNEAGKRLSIQRLDKHRIQVAASEGGCTVFYRVYANDLSVRTSHLDGTHGYFNGATLFLYSELLRDVPHRVTIDAPSGWKPFAALPQEGAEFVASNYDELVDSPFEVGPHQPASFNVRGVPHRLIVWGEGSPSREKLCQELQRICEAEAALFGGLPMRDYLFLVYLTDKGRGGLEHAASTALLFPRFGFNNSRGWEDFWSLAAHEYFHLWNVKRIKPRAFVPFDYTKECYTLLLWAFEGTTSYYDTLLVRRADLMSPSRYLVRLGEGLTQLQSTPGRSVQALSEASLLAWVKHYRPDENSPNSAISYYLKGEIVSALLDLEIRRATQNARSLDDVMRLLWKRYGDGSGVPEDGVEKAASEVAGRRLDGFFDLALRSTEELDYSVFSHVGLEVRYRTRESPSDRGGSPPRTKGGDPFPRGWLGIVTKGSSTIGTVLDESPALRAGLYADDELVALDGFRADAATLMARCEEKRPGEQVQVTVFRRDKLMTIGAILGEKPPECVYLVRSESPSSSQKAAYEAWLAAPWDDLT
jgi:predicted metalloprotease with PDZ domain